MNSFSLAISIKIIICMAIAVSFIYSYIDRQNELTALRLMIPSLTKELKALQEANKKLEFEVSSFEHPARLMSLLRTPEYSHLKFQENTNNPKFGYDEFGNTP